MHNCSRLAAIACAVFFATIAASPAAIVWDLNPLNQNAPVGSSSHTFTSSGFSITAYGFDNNGGIGVARELFYKHEDIIGGAVESGLGLNNVPHNELQAGLHFIQFDFSAAIAAGMLNGQLSVGSIQAGESFSIFGSNTLGTLGAQLGGTFGSTFDNQFVSLPNFGQFLYYSVMAMADDVIPVAIQADLPAIPEMSALWPIAGLALLILAVERRRRLRSAKA